MHYFISGAIAILASWLMTGCRFGNNVENPPSSAQQDTLTGYYESALANYQICAVFKDGTSHCADGNPAKVLDDWDLVMTNPVGFGWSNPAKPDAILIASDGSNYGINIKAVASGDISYHFSKDLGFFFLDPTHCTRVSSTEGSGKLHPGPAKKVNGLSTKGTLEINFSGKYTFTEAVANDCDNLMSKLYACHVDETKCQGSTAEENTQIHDSIVGFFKPYIDAGALTADEIQISRSLDYVLNYR